MLVKSRFCSVAIYIEYDTVLLNSTHYALDKIFRQNMLKEVLKLKFSELLEAAAVGYRLDNFGINQT
jgi:hypothetical protein